MKIFLLALLTYISLSIQVSVAQYSLINAYPQLPKFEKPLELRLANDGTNRMFVLEQTGKIFVFENTPLVSTRKLFLDLSDVVKNDASETGLLGMALHPNFKINKTFYINYDSDKSGSIKSYISSFKVSTANADSAIKKSEKQLLVVDDPAWNHNGGCLQFGPDKYLYFSLGDGGQGNDPWNNAQNLKSYWGKIHRINVDDTANGKKYGIPKDNPFINTAGALGEIYAYGLRNTWRFNFDEEDNNKLWAGDVGQNAWEEIDIIVKGGNYGWKIMEGLVCRPGGGATCDKKGLIDPIWMYKNPTVGTSITGGFVYRGKKIPYLKGKYVYADYTFGKIWALNPTPDVTNEMLMDRSDDTPIKVASFAEDFDKELLILSHGDGRILKLVSEQPNSSTAADSKDFAVSIIPNPNGPKSIVSVSILYPAKINIHLLDMSGKNIQTIANEDRSSGKHQFSFDTSKLKTGNYFVQVKAGKFEALKKFNKL